MRWLVGLLLVWLALVPRPAAADLFECRGMGVPQREALAAQGSHHGIYCLAVTRAAEYERIDHTWQCAKARPPAVAAVTRARALGLTDDYIEDLFQTGEEFCVTGEYQERQQEEAERRGRYMQCSARVTQECRANPSCTMPDLWRCNE